MTKPDFGCLLRILVEHAVDFLVVGGVGAVLQGASLSTFDLDIVHSMEQPANITRLLAALEDLDACYRAQPEKRIRVPVLNLETQIAVKEEEIGQEKDLAALPLLRRALEESRRKQGAE
jgi:hypothetical protein